MLKLIIGNKTYSSWSLRAWLALKGAGLEFEEIALNLGASDFKAQLARFGPLTKVPVLIDGSLLVWDSLAIIEYVAERFPEKPVWPADPTLRARARCLCAEMHAGFSALRSQLPMNLSVSLPGLGWNVAVQRDIARIETLWQDALAASGGPFLYGTFTAADAYYAPVVTRFLTYAVRLSDGARTYCQAVNAHPALAAWRAAAATEKVFLPEDEPYRQAL